MLPNGAKGPGSRTPGETMRRLLAEEGQAGDNGSITIVVTFPTLRNAPGAGPAAPQAPPSPPAPGATARSSEADPAAAAAADWAAPLNALARNATRTGCSIEPPSGESPGPAAPTLLALVPSSRSQLMVQVCAPAAGAVLAWLAEQPLVVFLEPGRAPTRSNAYASIAAQAGELPAGSLLDATSLEFRPFWRVGLDGTGQIIGGWLLLHAMLAGLQCMGQEMHEQ